MQTEYTTPEMENILTPEVVKFVQTETPQLSTAIQILEVKSQDDDVRAVELGLLNKSAINRLEAFRKAITQPLNDHVATINRVFKKLSEPFIANDSAVKSKRDIFLRERERLAQAQQKKIDEATRKEQERLNKKAEKKGVDPIILPPAPKIEPPKTTHTDIGRSTTRKILRFEVINADLIPREYLCPDEKKIGAAVRAKIATAIPGVRIWEDLSQTF